MTKVWVSLFLIFAFLLASGCSNGSSEGSSKLYLKLPESLATGSLSQKTQLAQATSDRRFCFAVNIKGTGISSTAKRTCDPEYGQFLGFVEGGTEIALEVKSGDNRTLELYYVATNESCPSIDPKVGMGSLGGNQIHRLAKLENIDMSLSEVTVTLPISLPSQTNTLQTLNEWPSSCEVNGGKISLQNRSARMVLGSHRALAGDGQYKISVRVGSPALLLKNDEHQIQITPHHLGADQ